MACLSRDPTSCLLGDDGKFGLNCWPVINDINVINDNIYSSMYQFNFSFVAAPVSD